MKRHLPPLNAIRVFEAAAKTESFRQTAETLFVTQSAVSKQIKLLEEHLGVTLFTRHGGAVELTEIGREYLSIISQALDIIEEGSAKFYSDQAQEKITVNLMPSLSGLWMFSRVEAFKEQHPDITLQIDSGDDEIDWNKKYIDAAIRCLPLKHTPKDAELLLKERLLLIARPQLFSHHNIEGIQGLKRQPCIGLSKRPGLWNDFYQQNGSDSGDITCHFSCEHFYMVIQAVLENHGLGLVPEFICQPFLEDKQLINPLGLSIESDYGYYLLTPPHKQSLAKVEKFRQWIKDEMHTFE